jgi:hypothetical protein
MKRLFLITAVFILSSQQVFADKEYESFLKRECMRTEADRFNVAKYCECEVKALLSVYKTGEEYNKYYARNKQNHLDKLQEYVDEVYWCVLEDDVDKRKAASQ